MLRLAQYASEDCARQPDGTYCLALSFEPGLESPRRLDAVLAVARGPVLAALRECLDEAPVDQGSLEAQLQELVARLEVRAGAGDAVVPGLALIRGEEYCALASAPFLHLLRHETLFPLGRQDASPAPPWAPPSPCPGGLVSGELREDDALLLASAPLQDYLVDREICRVLGQAYSPRIAAMRLSELAQQRGAGALSIAVLFAGANTPAQRSFIGAPAAPPTEAVPLPPPERAAGTVAMLAGLTGALIGVAAGLVIALMILRPGGRTGLPAAAESIRAEVQVSAPHAPEPLPTSPDRPSVPPAALAQPAEPPPAAAPAPAASPSPAPEFASVQAPPPAAIASAARPETPAPRARVEPPPHSLVPGMEEPIRLRLALDTIRGLLFIAAERGRLSTPQAPQGVSPGVPVAALMELPPREQLEDGRGEIRFLNPSASPAAAVEGPEVKRLLQGGTVHLPALSPGEYRLAWWHPEGNPEPQPFLALRISAH